MSPMQHHLSGDIAIVGMAGRFPGASDINTFWKNILSKTDCITHFEDSDLAAAGIDAEMINNPLYVKAFGVLEHVARFDNSFFGMSPAEAEVTDPQRRIFLECTWEALENAGCDPQNFKGPIGLFCGSSPSSYLLYHIYPDRGFPTSGNQLERIGNDPDFMASQVSWLMGFEGPAVNIASGEATALVATHLACQSLLGGECDLALAGAVSVQTPQIRGYYKQDDGSMSPDGRVRCFDAEASGSTPGNGVGVIVLKRLEEAIRDNDYIAAVISGSAVNNDGNRKPGFSIPGLDGRSEVIAEALALADTDPEDIGLIEANGAATPVGDPIEVAALSKAFGNVIDRQYCALGSVSSNIGNIGQAAGMASLIKAIKALENKTLPPTINCHGVNPHLDLEHSPFFINREAGHWESQDRRIAGVNAFAAGGTNSHVVLGEAPTLLATAKPQSGPFLLTISARDSRALRELVERWRLFLTGHEDLALYDICSAAAKRRAHHGSRLTVTGYDHAHMARNMGNWLEGDLCEGLSHGVTRGRFGPEPVFVFSGLGPPWCGIGRDLLETRPEFARMIRKCDGLISDLANFSIFDILSGNDQETNVEAPAAALPLAFAIQVSISSMLEAMGVQPGLVIGHGPGEVAAAHVAGVLSLEDAVMVTCAQARTLEKARGNGSMAFIELPENCLLHLLEESGDQLSIAALNGPETCLVAQAFNLFKIYRF